MKVVVAEPTAVVLLEVQCNGFGRFPPNLCDVAWVFEDTILGRAFTSLAREVGADRLGLSRGENVGGRNILVGIKHSHLLGIKLLDSGGSIRTLLLWLGAAVGGGAITFGSSCTIVGWRVGLIRSVAVIVWCRGGGLVEPGNRARVNHKRRHLGLSLGDLFFECSNRFDCHTIIGQVDLRGIRFVDVEVDVEETRCTFGDIHECDVKDRE